MASLLPTGAAWGLSDGISQYKKRVGTAKLRSRSGAVRENTECKCTKYTPGVRNFTTNNTCITLAACLTDSWGIQVVTNHPPVLYAANHQNIMCKHVGYKVWPYFVGSSLQKSNTPRTVLAPNHFPNTNKRSFGVPCGHLQGSIHWKVVVAFFIFSGFLGHTEGDPNMAKPKAGTEAPIRGTTMPTHATIGRHGHWEMTDYRWISLHRTKRWYVGCGRVPEQHLCQGAKSSASNSS